jgi:hypothetical protein
VCNKLSNVTTNTNLTITLLPYPTKSCYDTPPVQLHVNGVFLNYCVFTSTYTNPTTHAIGVCRNNCVISNRISYYVCTFNDVSYVVRHVEVATPPVQVLFPHPGTLKCKYTMFDCAGQIEFLDCLHERCKPRCIVNYFKLPTKPTFASSPGK